MVEVKVVTSAKGPRKIRMAPATELTEEAVALLAPATTPVEVKNPPEEVVTEAATEEEAAVAEIMDRKDHRTACLDSPGGTRTVRAFPGDGEIIRHPEDPMPRFGNERGRLISINSET